MRRRCVSPCASRRSVLCAFTRRRVPPEGVRCSEVVKLEMPRIRKSILKSQKRRPCGMCLPVAADDAGVHSRLDGASLAVAATSSAPLSHLGSAGFRVWAIADFFNQLACVTIDFEVSCLPCCTVGVSHAAKAAHLLVQTNVFFLVAQVAGVKTSQAALAPQRGANGLVLVA